MLSEVAFTFAVFFFFFFWGGEEKNNVVKTRGQVSMSSGSRVDLGPRTSCSSSYFVSVLDFKI